MLMAIPLAGLLAVTGYGVYLGWTQSVEASGLEERTDLALSSYRLIDSLEAERRSLIETKSSTPELRQAVQDYLHEPYRLPRIPGGQAAIKAGVAAGAWTGWLSGSGSSVLCVSDAAHARKAAEAMQAAFNVEGIASQIRLLSADNTGLKVEVAEPVSGRA